jgi:uncharacterized protein (DUF1501 family)
MKRRSFLAAATALTCTFALSRRGRAQSATSGPLFLSIEANQAWDTTTTVDPVGHPEFSPYGNDDVVTFGGLRVAPNMNRADRRWMVRRLSPDGTSTPVDFFATYGAFLRVINGVDHRTVSHDIGPRHAFSGTLREGFPAVGALAAAVQGRDRPLAFLSTGGFDDTQGIVSLTRSGRQNVLRELARPNSANGLATAPTFLPGGVEALVQREQQARDQRRAAALSTRRSLPGVLRSQQALVAGRASEGAFLSLANTLDGSPATDDNNALIAATGLVLAAMRTEPASCASAHLSFGNFDTHFDHDDPVDGHAARMVGLLEGIGHLIDEIENNPANEALRARGVLVYVSSDFGRTAYNGGEDEGTRGKDHWPVTSSILIGLGAMRAQVGGGTAIGRTTPTLNGQVQPGVRAHPWRIDGNGNLVTANAATATGDDLFSLTPAEVNFALRHALQLDEEQAPAGARRLVDRFALPEVDPRFTAAIADGHNPLLKDA